MEPKKISSVTAHNDLSDLINRVIYLNETFIIQKNGRDVAQLGPITPNGGPEKPKKKRAA